MKKLRRFNQNRRSKFYILLMNARGFYPFCFDACCSMRRAMVS